MGCATVIFWTALFAIPYLVIVKKCCLRVSKVNEIIGIDAALSILGKKDVENHVQFVITEYYPENAGEYLLKKKRLLELARKGKKKAKKQLTVDEMLKIKELLRQELEEAYGTEAQLQPKDQDDAVDHHEEKNTEEDKPPTEKDGLVFKADETQKKMTIQAKANEKQRFSIFRKDHAKTQMNIDGTAGLENQSVKSSGQYIAFKGY